MRKIGMKDIYVARILENTATSYKTGLPASKFTNLAQPNTKITLNGEYTGAESKTLNIKYTQSTSKFQYSYDGTAWIDITDGLNVDGITFKLPSGADIPTADKSDNVMLTKNTGFYNLARAINGKCSDKYSTDNLYSDDALEETVRSFSNVDIELEVNRILNDRKALLYGQTLNGGMISSSIEDQASDIAIGWRNKLSNGKYEFVWYYCVSVTDGEESNSETVGDKPKAQSDKIKLIGRAREKADSDGKHRYKVAISEDQLIEANTDAAAAIKNWFSKVQEPILTA